jgi:hypothetical protein
MNSLSLGIDIGTSGTMLAIDGIGEPDRAGANE